MGAAEGDVFPCVGAYVVRAPLAVLAFALLLPATNTLALNPQPSCIPVHTPAYPSPDSAPTIVIWHREDLDRGNRSSSSCAGSPSPIDSRSRLIVTLRGSFHFDGSMSAILARVGAISALRNIQYWST